jgi:oligopeptide/dipeptide ABC transporter ATP-binding protein
MGMSTILITHDLGIIAGMADRVAIFYAGMIVEQARVEDIFDDARHPYTKGLLNSIPSYSENSDRLQSIPGNVPSIFNFTPSCRFADRCPIVSKKCRALMPNLNEVTLGHQVRCWNLN